MRRNSNLQAARSKSAPLDSSSGAESDDTSEDMSEQALNKLDLIFAFAPSVGHSLLHHSCSKAAKFAKRIPGFGATQFILKTIIRDTCCAMKASDTAPFPPDFFSWGPPGPGARKCLRRFKRTDRQQTALTAPASSKAKRRRHSKASWSLGKARDQDLYSALSSWSGRLFRKELISVHKEVLASAFVAELEQNIGMKWGVHDTQGGLCLFEKYLSVRGAVVRKQRFPASMRWYRTVAFSPWRASLVV